MNRFAESDMAGHTTAPLSHSVHLALFHIQSRGDEYTAQDVAGKDDPLPADTCQQDSLNVPHSLSSVIAPDLQS